MNASNENGFEARSARTSTTEVNPRLPIHAAHGTELTAKSWQTEAPLRMLMNNLDPDNAERPEDLVVYGGTGKAARDWPSYAACATPASPARARTATSHPRSRRPSRSSSPAPSYAPSSP